MKHKYKKVTLDLFEKHEYVTLRMIMDATNGTRSRAVFYLDVASRFLPIYKQGTVKLKGRGRPLNQYRVFNGD